MLGLPDDLGQKLRDLNKDHRAGVDLIAECRKSLLPTDDKLENLKTDLRRAVNLCVEQRVSQYLPRLKDLLEYHARRSDQTEVTLRACVEGVSYGYQRDPLTHESAPLIHRFVALHRESHPIKQSHYSPIGNITSYFVLTKEKLEELPGFLASTLYNDAVQRMHTVATTIAQREVGINGQDLGTRNSAPHRALNTARDIQTVMTRTLAPEKISMSIFGRMDTEQSSIPSTLMPVLAYELQRGQTGVAVNLSYTRSHFKSGSYSWDEAKHTTRDTSEMSISWSA